MKKALILTKISGRKIKMTPPGQIWKNNQTGAVILAIVVTMTIVAILGAAMLNLSSSSSFSEVFINKREKAYYLAQAGRQYATMTIINAYNAGDNQAIIDLNGQTFTLAGGNEFYLTTTIVKAGVTIVESTGMVNQNTVLETKQKIAFTVKDPSLILGAAAVGKITLNSGSFIDAYKGVYAFNPIGMDAIVQTNSNAASMIVLNKDAVIYGSAYCGAADPDAIPPIPACNPTASITTVRSARILGDRLPATKNNSAPTLALPTGGTLITIQEGTGLITNITAGKYEARDPSNNKDIVMNGSIINISGIVTLIVDGTLTMYNSSRINIQTGGMLTLWIKTRLEVGNLCKINDLGQPTNVLIKGILMTDLAFVQSSKAYCAIYAPGSDVSIDQTSELYGSVFAGTLSMSGGNLHLDMAFTDSTNVGY